MLRNHHIESYRNLLLVILIGSESLQLLKIVPIEVLLFQIDVIYR